MRLYFLELGRIDMDQRVIMPASPPGPRLTVPVPAYLLRLDTGETVLIDSGMPRDVLDETAGFGERMRPLGGTAVYVTERLAALGVRPDDVTHVVATHFHFDHAGGLSAFPGATVVAQRRAVEAARAKGGAWERRAVADERIRWQLVDGDVALFPGVRLLETSGHTLGHQSVLVELPSGARFLLAIDAIYTQDQLDADDWGAYVDAEQARASAHKVQRLAAETGATLVYGHDAARWATFRHAPDYYE